MRHAKLAFGRVAPGAVVALLTVWLLTSPLQLKAQNSCPSPSTGQDAVYNTSCHNGPVVGSSAFIDASQFGKNNTDICAVLYGILSSASTSYPANGAIVDARGLPGNTGTSMTCATNTTPWSQDNNVHVLHVSSTILLPAGTIQIPATWVLPSNTRLVGQGENNPLSATPGTTIQAAVPSLASMIQFGSSATSVCANLGVVCGISVERLTLDGKAQSIDGIINQLSQSNTYVDHVTIYQVMGTGLLISGTSGGSASNSGPYTNITFDTGIYSGTNSTVCAQISNVSGGLTGTKGIHGLRCKSENQDAPAAVLLDASNNSIEDVTIVGFFDGVLVGKNAAAQSNLLLNIIGDTSLVSGGTPINAIHISNHHTVTDLAIMGVSNGGMGTNTIEDDVTSTTLGDASVGIYALGQSTSNGHTRYTTSPNAPSWAVGAASPGGTCARGSLYSCNNVNCTAALWACSTPSGSFFVWTAVK
jgi:hypothetical protein